MRAAVFFASLLAMTLLTVLQPSARPVKISSLRRTAAKTTTTTSSNISRGIGVENSQDDVGNGDGEEDSSRHDRKLSANVFMHQQRKSGVGVGSSYGYATPNNYWSVGHNTNSWYPAPTPPKLRPRRPNRNKKKEKRKSCYVKCCRKMRGRGRKGRARAKRKCRRKCSKRRPKPRPKLPPTNPCGRDPCPRYPCGRDPCPKAPCPGEKKPTCDIICANKCRYFAITPQQCVDWTNYCKPFCPGGPTQPPSSKPSGEPSSIPSPPPTRNPSRSPSSPPTPKATVPISARIASGLCECGAPGSEEEILPDNTSIDVFGRLIASDVEEEIESTCNAIYFFEGLPPAPPPPDDSQDDPPVQQVVVATPVQKFIVPLRENILFQTFDIINSASRPPVTTLVSIAVPADDTIIWYDHWEDGYETDLQNVGSFTEVWGDGNPANGCIECRNTNGNSGRLCEPKPGSICSRDGVIDRLEAGTAIVLQNEVPLTRSGNRDPNSRRSSPDNRYFYDGGDAIFASFPVAITRSAYPRGDSNRPNSLEAGAVEVRDTNKWGKVFKVPVGQDLKAQNIDLTDAFEEADVYITVAESNTDVTVPRPAGRRRIEVTISKSDGTSFTRRISSSSPDSDRRFTVGVGQTVRIKNLNSDERIESSKPVQANLITGDRRSNFEMRWYSLPPVDQFVDEYYTPVTRRSGSNGGTAVFLYNPSPNKITVFDETRDGTQTPHDIGAGGVVKVELNRGRDTNSGHRFFTKNMAPFFGLSVTDSLGDGEIVDWGANLLPASELTPKVIVGLGRACTGGPRLSSRHSDTTCRSQSGSLSNSVQPSPVWVTPTEDAKFRVDYNCDNRVDKVFPASGSFAGKLESVLIVDGQDQDMTGACITAFGRNGQEVTFAAAWGQDSSQRGSRESELDLGTLIPSLLFLSVFKQCDLLTDSTCRGEVSPSDEISCSIRITNTGSRTVNELTVTDKLPPRLTFESAKTIDVNGDTDILFESNYPLENGRTFKNIILAPGKSFTIQYVAKIDSVESWLGSGVDTLQGTTTIQGTAVDETASHFLSTTVTVCDDLSSTPSSSPSLIVMTETPSLTPSRLPSFQPSKSPSSRPSSAPSSRPSTWPSSRPSPTASSEPSSTPTSAPSSIPSRRPSPIPTPILSNTPSDEPSLVKSFVPSRMPSATPSSDPSVLPTVEPSSKPSLLPSARPSSEPSQSPTGDPTSSPSSMPSRDPSSLPSNEPSSGPSSMPSSAPSREPSSMPSLLPTSVPSSEPSRKPTGDPTSSPSSVPSSEPSRKPTGDPTSSPSLMPSSKPSAAPSETPSSEPSTLPSSQPSAGPSSTPSAMPSGDPSSQPSDEPSLSPSFAPSLLPSSLPSLTPSTSPSSAPSSAPSVSPSSRPSSMPSAPPSKSPSSVPSSLPSSSPSSIPSPMPSVAPSLRPSSRPSGRPSTSPSIVPSDVPSAGPTLLPSTYPSHLPSSTPSSPPSNRPSKLPSFRPSIKPSKYPSSTPSAMPSSSPTTPLPSFSPTTPFPTQSPTTLEPTGPPEPQTTCAFRYDITTDTTQPFYLYGYSFRTASTACLFVRVVLAFADELIFQEVCSGYVQGQGSNANSLVPESLCNLARFPPSSDVSVRIEYALSPDPDRCSSGNVQSTCACVDCESLRQTFGPVDKVCDALADN